MNRQGTGAPPLRGLAGFGGQASQTRNAPLGSGRLPGGKLGSGSGWGFGIQSLAAAPGLPNPQSRPSSAAMTSFARTIGGSQPATPLDLTEFPSLSSAQAQANHNAGQAAWSNTAATATARGHAPSTVQPRGQASLNSNGSTTTPQPSLQQAPASRGQENIFPSATQFAGGLDDYAFGAQQPVGQLTTSTQSKSGTAEEFPPLGRNANGEIGQARAGGLSNGAFGGAGVGANGFGAALTSLPNGTGRSTLTGMMQASQDRARPLGLGNLPQTSAAAGEQDRSAASRTALNGSAVSSLFAGMQNSEGGSAGPTAAAATATSQSTPFGPAAVGRSGAAGPGGGGGGGGGGGSQSGAAASAFGGDLAESPRTGATAEALSSMSEMERYGLGGLVYLLRNEGSDMGSLTIGQDLTTLGLDLSQPDPLYHTFSSPFAEAGARTVEPDFVFPACYQVQNIQPLSSKVSSFSDETLFYVFYQMPRDVMQEVAASELTNRNWRYHKELKQWLTKDVSFEPVRVSATEEQGFYIFFDPVLWQRQRREFLLQYDHLDTRPMQALPASNLPAIGPM